MTYAVEVDSKGKFLSAPSTCAQLDPLMLFTPANCNA